MKREEAWVLLKKNSQYCLIAPFEITVTVSINIWTLTPQITQKLGIDRKYSTCYWNAASLRWSKHSSYSEFTETLHSHLDQEAIPLHPAETIHGLFFIWEAKCSFMDWNVLPGYSNSTNRKQSGAHFSVSHQDPWRKSEVWECSEEWVRGEMTRHFETGELWMAWIWTGVTPSLWLNVK